MTRHDQPDLAETAVPLFRGTQQAPFPVDTRLGGAQSENAVTLAVRDLINQVLDEDQAEDVLILDLAGKTTIADFMIIASGRSNRHVAALARNVCDKLRDIGVRPPEPEGLNTCDWVIVDAGDVILHVFRPEVRSFYNLEKMWGIEATASEPVLVRMM